VAGNFGFEKEHFDVSMLVAEQSLAPALRQTEADSVVLTDGFSCAMQVKQLDDSRPGRHLAQLLDPGEQAAVMSQTSRQPLPSTQERDPS
jgi:Fe-S oxidoreductase